MISKETIEKIKEKAKVTELVQELTQIKRQGGRFVACCPFHNEKTPSFHIRDDDKSYFCFGCGAKGTAISFIMETKGLTFPQSLEFLAQKYSIPIERVKSSSNKDKNNLETSRNLYKLNAIAQRFFEQSLVSAPTQVKEYIHLRGISPDLVKAFGVGFTGKDFLQHCLDKKVPETLLLTSGLIKRSSDGRLYEALRDRLTFPILTDAKRVCGFGGRIIPSLIDDTSKLDTIPKYLNSPETPVYQKKRQLYGLPQALPMIREKKECFVVEGYLDVIGLYGAGVKNSVATCGTALTPEHITRLERIARKVYILFDGDKAGRSAAARSFQLFLNSKVEVLGLFLPQGEDPDSIAQRYKATTYEYLMSLRTVPLLDCYLQGILEKEGLENFSAMSDVLVAETTQNLREILSTVKDNVVRERLTERAAAKLKLKESFIRVEGTNTFMHKESAPSSISNDTGIPVFGVLPHSAQELLRVIFVQRLSALKEVFSHPDAMEIFEPSIQSLLSTLYEIFSQTDMEASKKQLQDLLKAIDPSWRSAWKSAHSMEILSSPEALESAFNAIQKQKDAQRIKNIEDELKLNQDLYQKQELLKQLISLRKIQG